MSCSWACADFLSNALMRRDVSLRSVKCSRAAKHMPFAIGTLQSCLAATITQICSEHEWYLGYLRAQHSYIAGNGRSNGRI